LIGRENEPCRRGEWISYSKPPRSTETNAGTQGGGNYPSKRRVLKGFKKRLRAGDRARNVLWSWVLHCYYEKKEKTGKRPHGKRWPGTCVWKQPVGGGGKGVSKFLADWSAGRTVGRGSAKGPQDRGGGEVEVKRFATGHRNVWWEGEDRR